MNHHSPMSMSLRQVTGRVTPDRNGKIDRIVLVALLGAIVTSWMGIVAHSSNHHDSFISSGEELTNGDDLLVETPAEQADPQDELSVWADQLAFDLKQIRSSVADPHFEVMYGTQTLNPETNQSETHWGEAPFNVVKVSTGIGDPTVSESDEEAVRIIFSGTFREDGLLLRGEATAQRLSTDVSTSHDRPQPIITEEQISGE